MALLGTRALKAFYGDFQALYGIDTELAPGETVAIIGANGADKTTILNSISGILPINDGKILFAGKDITRQEPKS
jgi:branched-chain amino acid transport system ATP-binding protein